MSQSAEIALSIKSNLGEGSLWDPATQKLLWVDILDHKVHAFDPASGTNKTLEVKEYPSTIVVRQGGGAAITLKNGYAALDLDTGKTEMLCEVEADLDGNRFNDGKCDPAGRFWAGTMDFNLAPGKGGLYRMGSDHKAVKILDDISCSNGLVWTADHKTMYYIDSLTQEVHALDYNHATGDVSNRRVAVSISKETGFPDGMAIDSEGMVWVALFWGGGVNRYNPGTGELIGRVETPGCHLVTSCAFGGKNLDTLYITSASCDYQNADWEKYPNAGCLFKANVGVTGVPSSNYHG